MHENFKQINLAMWTPRSPLSIRFPKEFLEHNCQAKSTILSVCENTSAFYRGSLDQTASPSVSFAKVSPVLESGAWDSTGHHCKFHKGQRKGLSPNRELQVTGPHSRGEQALVHTTLSLASAATRETPRDRAHISTWAAIHPWQVLVWEELVWTRPASSQLPPTGPLVSRAPLHEKAKHLKTYPICTMPVPSG